MVLHSRQSSGGSDAGSERRECPIEVGWRRSWQPEGQWTTGLASGEGDELKLVGRHYASVEAALIIALAFLCGCHSLLLLAHPAVSGVGKLERPVWLGKEEQP